MATKFEPELGEGPPPPPIEDRDVEPPKAAEKRRAAERRRKAERFPGEVPPPPITEKFPGEAPPYPAGYTPPEGKVAEVDAKGRPTVIVTSAGLRQYTPNATMFKMGYLTSDQYGKSGPTRGAEDVPSTAFLPIASEKGEALMIDKEVAFALQSKRPRDQFKAMQEMGIIEHNSKFVPGFGGKWSFVPTREIARVRGVKGQIAFEKQRRVKIDAAVAKLEDQWVNAAYAEIDKRLKGEKEIVKEWAREDAKWAVEILAEKYATQLGVDETATLPAIARAVGREFTPWKEEEGEKATPAGVSLMAAELLIPGVYAVNRWEDLSPGWRAFVIGVDVLSVMPLVAAIGRGARTVGIAGKAARATAAAKAGVREMAMLVTAPIDMIIHPIGTAKTAARETRSLLENIAHPRKIPEAVLTTSEGTVRLKVTEATTPVQARAIRDELMDLAVRGEKPVVEIGGTRVELARSPLMRELEGGAAHATPTGEVFEGGLVVSKKAGMPATEQGLFLSHEPLPRFAEASAFGKTGEKPTIIIFSREVAEQSVSTGKIYDSPFGAVAEMERKFPVGFEVPGVAQKLFTRIGPTGQRVELYLGKPLSARQIAKLKLEGLVETFKAPFQPAIKVKNFDQVVPGLTPKQSEALVGMLRASGNIDEARNLARAIRLSRAMRSAPPSTGRILGRLTRGESRAARVARERLERVRPERTRAGRERAARERVARERMARERPERERAERERIERERVERLLRERPDRERPERERIERERAERERVERERAERERPGRERPERTRPERERIERERLERERIILEGDELRLIPPKGGTDKEKRARIKAAGGAVAWRQGALAGKPIYHVLMHPYVSEADYVMVVGRKPAGASVATGKGSAYKTIKRLRGKAPGRTIAMDMGIQDIAIIPKGKEVGIRFTPDPKQETTGDITITRRPPPLDRGRGGFGRRMPRITPKTPRLRR